MNKLLFAALMLAGSVQGVHAEEAFAYPYLTFQTTDGTQQSVAAESLEITIEGSELVAQNATSGVRILLTQLEKMYFTANPSGIEAVEVAQAAATHSPTGRQPIPSRHDEVNV